VGTDTRRILLSKAADLIGRQDLAAGLNISPALLDSWISGSATMPAGKLSALAHLLEEISNPPKQ
jgi:DNA-binding transcriptional regulator YdaS (Cro superfamily)